MTSDQPVYTLSPFVIEPAICNYEITLSVTNILGQTVTISATDNQADIEVVFPALASSFEDF